MHGLLLCDDLLFSSRVVGTAKALGLQVRTARSPVELFALATDASPSCVIVDLNTPGLAIEALPARWTPRPFLIGYGSHVDAATLNRARDAGFDVVWPRSKFVEELERSIPIWFHKGEPGA